MKIIHTYLPIRIPDIDKKTIYQMTLSVLLAKKHYDKVVLYTNVNTAKIVREIGLPYDEINDQLLEGNNTHTFSIPKLIVYAAQDEPFIHVDLDAFLFAKQYFNKLDGIYSTYNEGHKGMLNMNDVGFYDTYVKRTFELRDKLPKDFLKHIKFTNIPNMSLFGGYNYKLIAKSSAYCLDIYEKNRNFFDSYYYNACIIEQLFIPAAARLLSNDANIKINYLFKKGNPSSIFSLDNNYPFEVRSNGESIIINNEIDLFSNINYEFNGFLHLCGNKYMDAFLFLLRSKIMFVFRNSNFIKKIDEIFPEKYGFEKSAECYDEMKKIINKKRNIM